MARILVGTTSWTEKTLVESGHFYPSEVHTVEARLRFYASRFSIMEVDSTCVVLFQFAPWFVYRPSSLELISTCVERLPGDRIAVELRNKSWFAE